MRICMQSFVVSDTTGTPHGAGSDLERAALLGAASSDEQAVDGVGVAANGLGGADVALLELAALAAAVAKPTAHT